MQVTPSFRYKITVANANLWTPKLIEDAGRWHADSALQRAVSDLFQTGASKVPDGSGLLRSIVNVTAGDDPTTLLVMFSTSRPLSNEQIESVVSQLHMRGFESAVLALVETQ